MPEIGQTISHYKILQKIGGGGMGVVYKAEDTSLHRQVALKFLPEEISKNPEVLMRFEREAQAASALNHPHICTIYEFNKSEGQTFIAMELLEGKTLKQRMTEGRLNGGELFDVALQIAEALEAAHKKGIIHRDIKPANIFIAQDGKTKILDFGLAKLPEERPDSSETTVAAEQLLTYSGTAIGTAAYMSPEQTRGEKIDVRSDVFSFGVVLYEMATGRHPFQGKTTAITFDAILNREPLSILSLNPSLPEGITPIVKKALQKDRNTRYQSVEDLLRDLRRLQQERLNRSPSLFRRFRWVLISALVVLFALAVHFIWQGIGTRRGPKIPATKALAVIPFSSTGGTPSDQSISDGLMEGITNRLTQLEKFHTALEVVPASEVRSREISSVEEASKYYGISLAVTGNFQCQGNSARLLLNLIDARIIRQLDSRTVYGLKEDPWALQENGVVQLAEMLELHLNPEAFNVPTPGESAVRGASKLYIEARGNLQRFDRPENLEAAIRAFEEATAKDQRYALAYAGLGEAYWRKYQVSNNARWRELAIQNCDRALDLDRRIADAHVTRGLILAGEGQYDLSLAAFRRALDVAPRNSDAYRGLAQIYSQIGRTKEAEATFQKAIQLRPNLIHNYNLLGRFYLDHGRYEQAAMQYRKMIDLAPDSYWGYNNLGAVYMYLERWADARRMFEKVLQITPDYGALSNLGTLDFEEGRFVEAASLYEKALEQFGQSYELYGNLASACYRIPGMKAKSQENYLKAARMAEEVLNVNPKNTRALTHIALYYAMMGERERSLASLRSALSLSQQEAEDLYRAALVYERLGEREKALHWLAKSLEQGYSRSLIERSQELRPLREDPRYRSLIQTLHSKE
jgi:serine/threonine protein kinase/Tfp pilus assembly protein PilF